MTSEKPTRRKRLRTGTAAFGTVDGTSDDARLSLARADDPVGRLTESIRGMIVSEIDPYLLAGVLLEGVAQIVATRIPKNRQADTVMATLALLDQRLRACIENSVQADHCDTTSGRLQ